MSKQELTITEIGSDDEYEDAIGTEKQPLEDKLSSLALEEKGDDSDKDAEFEAASSEVETKPSDEQTFDDLIDEVEQKELDADYTDEELEANYEESKKLKAEGNELFKSTDLLASIQAYTKALRKCPTKYPKDRAILYSNRAAAKISLQSKKGAIQDCSQAIELDPSYVRPLIRRAKLREELEQYDECLEDFKKIIELDPANAEAREATCRLPPIIEARNEKLKEEMFGKLKDLGNMILRPFGLSTSNFQMQQDPSTGSYSINFNNK